MKPVSKFSIILTVIALIIIGWIVFTHHDPKTPLNSTSDPTAPTAQATWPSVEVEQKMSCSVRLRKMRLTKNFVGVKKKVLEPIQNLEKMQTKK